MQLNAFSKIPKLVVFLCICLSLLHCADSTVKSISSTSDEEAAEGEEENSDTTDGTESVDSGIYPKLTAVDLSSGSKIKISIETAGAPSDAEFAIQAKTFSSASWISTSGAIGQSEPQWASLSAWNNGTDFIVSGLTLNTLYFLRVVYRTSDGSYTQSLSNATVTRITPSRPDAPEEPTNLSLTYNAGAGTITVAWSSGGGTTAGFYVDYRHTANNLDYSDLALKPKCTSASVIDVGAATSYVISVAAPNATHTYHILVCAYNNAYVRDVSWGVLGRHILSSNTVSIFPTLSVNGPIAGDEFGYSVGSLTEASSSGLRIVVGAPNHNLDSSDANTVTGAGAAFIYKQTTSTSWTLIKKLVASGTNGRNVGDRLGHSVAIGGNATGTDLYTIVGAPQHDYDESGANYISNAGAVYVYKLNSGTSQWELIQKLVSPNRTSNGMFGFETEIKVGGLFAGAPGEGAGKVHFYKLSGGVWTLGETISGQNNGDEFGSSIEGSYNEAADTVSVFIGAPGHDYDASETNLQADAGAAYFYTGVTGTNSTWDHKFVADNGGAPHARNAGDRFGTQAAVGSSFIISAPYHDYDYNGANYLKDAGAMFEFSANAPYTYLAKYSASSSHTNQRVANMRLGWSLSHSITGHFMAGSPYYPYNANGEAPIPNSGAAFGFYSLSVTGGANYPIYVLEHSDRKPNAYFGWATQLDLVSLGLVRTIGAPSTGTNQYGNVRMSCSSIAETEGSALLAWLILLLPFAVLLHKVLYLRKSSPHNS